MMKTFRIPVKIAKADMGLSEHESPRGHIGDTPKVGPAGWNL